MKKGYIKLLVFQIIIFSMLFINSFISNILSGYKEAILLVLLLVLFKIIFGFERDNHRFTKDIIFEVIVFLIVFFILFYLLGFFIGFAKTQNYRNWYSVKTFILPIALNTILLEFFRYQMLNKSEGCKILSITTYLLFFVFDITNSLTLSSFDSKMAGFLLVALTILPAISENALCHYISPKVGYKPLIFYILVIDLYDYIFPIIPNPNRYLISIITFILPIVLLFRLKKLFIKEKDEYLDRDYKKENKFAYIIPAILVFSMVYFTSGMFGYQTFAIASGSMEPTIHKGDIVVIKKITDNYNRINVGDVIAYTHSKVVVVHRVIDKVELNDEVIFYTKGDYNESMDNNPVTEDMIVGVVSYRLPYAGLPTVWLNNL